MRRGRKGSPGIALLQRTCSDYRMEHQRNPEESNVDNMAIVDSVTVRATE